MNDGIDNVVTIKCVRDAERIMKDARAYHYGFLKASEVATLRLDATHRLTPLLIRFHEGRLTAPAQDVDAIIAGLEKAGWGLRDVSLPARQEPAAPPAPHHYNIESIYSEHPDVDILLLKDRARRISISDDCIVTHTPGCTRWTPTETSGSMCNDNCRSIYFEDVED
jgi:hypothetical protein